MERSRDPSVSELLNSVPGVGDVDMRDPDEEALLNYEEEEEVEVIEEVAVENEKKKQDERMDVVIVPPPTGKRDETPTLPIMSILAKSKEILDGASTSKQSLSGMERKQAEKRIHELETKLAIA
ncbi:hypothetical protein PENTCL1PPCAC_25396, partial [Pristionchus entomophagus]